jgi:hypothetical protein
MFRFPRTTTAVAASLTLALSLSACGNKDQDNRTTETAGGAVETAAPVRVADVTLGRGIGSDKRITTETDDFGRRDTIYASVRTTGTGTGTQLIARWTFQDGQIVDERTETISPTGETYTEFHITKPTAWPTGKYTLHVLLDGTEVETEEFEIK